MGQLISSHGGKRSQNDLNESNSVDSIPTKIGFETSIRYLPSLKIGLENGDFDLTRWEPQQLITTYLPVGSLQGEAPRGRAKISFSSGDIREHQTTTQSDGIKTIKETDEEQSDLLSDGWRILEAEEGNTQLPIELSDTQGDEKDDELDSVSRNQRTRSRAQHGRKALTREVNRLSCSASADDMTQITSYPKTHEASQIPYCKQFLDLSNIFLTIV
jgi:hypothetical protein